MLLTCFGPLTLKTTTPQNGQIHSKNSINSFIFSIRLKYCLSVIDHFLGLAFKWLRDCSVAYLKPS